MKRLICIIVVVLMFVSLLPVAKAEDDIEALKKLIEELEALIAEKDAIIDELTKGITSASLPSNFKDELCNGFWRHKDLYDTAVTQNGKNIPYTICITDIYRFAEDNSYVYTCYSYTTLLGKVDKLREISGFYSIKDNKIELSKGGMEGETSIPFIIDEMTDKISFHITDNSGETDWRQFIIEGDYDEEFIMKYFAVP